MSSRSRATLPRRTASTSCLQRIGDRPVDVLVANAGHGLGHGFLDQSPDEWQHVINTNITGTLLLIQPIVRRMVERGQGKVLITGRSPATWPALSRRSTTVRRRSSTVSRRRSTRRLRDSGVTVTCLKPGATETELLPPRRARRYQSRPSQEGRSRRCRQDRLGSDDERRASRDPWAQEQDSGRRGRRHDGCSDG